MFSYDLAVTSGLRIGAIGVVAYQQSMPVVNLLGFGSFYIGARTCSNLLGNKIVTKLILSLIPQSLEIIESPKAERIFKQKCFLTKLVVDLMMFFPTIEASRRLSNIAFTMSLESKEALIVMIGAVSLSMITFEVAKKTYGDKKLSKYILAPFVSLVATPNDIKKIMGMPCRYTPDSRKTACVEIDVNCP